MPLIPGLAKPVQVQISSSHSPASPGNTHTLSVSTTFFDGANLSSEPQDLILISEDSVYFYVSSKVILEKSNNRFQNMIPFTSFGEHHDVILVTESCAALSLMIHAVYGISCTHHPIPFEIISSTVTSFPLYGFAPQNFIIPDSWLYNMIKAQAPLFPIAAYCLAASFDLFDLAATVSDHLHSFVLSDLTDELATRMGPIYLKRLFGLHLRRQEALKRILVSPPEPHPESRSCTSDNQRQLGRAWSLAATSFIWNPRPDTPNEVLEDTFGAVANNFDCQDCKRALDERVRDVVTRWSMEARTISRN